MHLQFAAKSQNLSQSKKKKMEQFSEMTCWLQPGLAPLLVIQFCTTRSEQCHPMLCFFNRKFENTKEHLVHCRRQVSKTLTRFLL